jgi:protein-tyrosine phosphatase
MTNQTMLSSAGDRELSWDGRVNARDLGGLGRVRPGAVIRMEAPARLTEAGWAAASTNVTRQQHDPG